MFISKDICPVPFDQQPLNEFCSLKKSCFFSWLNLNIRDYIKGVISIYFLAALLFIPLVLTFKELSLLQFFLLDNLCVAFIVILFLIRLYLGWSYITKRLLSATIFYEESGWHDGQFWIKTADMLTKDRLIGMYQVIPFLHRIEYTLAIFLLALIFESMFYYLICN
uniref:Ycf36 n=1 Tax=Sporolithon durum TaxID=48970 RepID=A0A141SCR3_9FLOR|nr:hypothetical protein Sdur_021 [Sporolithon durum]AMK96081.1 hypothetical protein Sdur_021 [Sporolithon durum]